MRVTHENIRATVGCRGADTQGSEHAQPCPVSASQPVPSQCHLRRVMSVQAAEGRGLPEEDTWFRAFMGRTARKWMGAPATAAGPRGSPRCRAACPQDRPVLLPAWRDHRRVPVYASQSPISLTKHACLVLPLPRERVLHSSGAMFPRGDFPRPSGQVGLGHAFLAGHPALFSIHLVT